MMICPNCKHNNMAGAMFCSECGTQLVSKNDMITQHISTDTLANNAGKKPTGGIPNAQTVSDAWANLHILETGQMLPLTTSRTEYTMGRVSEGQPIMPDIDFSPFQAYAAGVSRLHAVIKRVGSNIIFMDLGSANGTYVNGKRLVPNHEQTLSHGDIVALGKLKMQVLVNK
jgi:hypothetical protein